VANRNARRAESVGHHLRLRRPQRRSWQADSDPKEKHPAATDDQLCLVGWALAPSFADLARTRLAEVIER
jgi:hypothetical protein